MNVRQICRYKTCENEVLKSNDFCYVCATSRKFSPIKNFKLYELIEDDSPVDTFELGNFIYEKVWVAQNMYQYIYKPHKVTRHQ